MTDGQERIVAQQSPYVLELEPGRYMWCQCGRSSRQPFCDGAHKGTAFRPVAVEITEKKRIALCGCKRTGNEPVCDGTHKGLPPQTRPADAG
ncbi:MAG: CDGSH iron-sulfur domain-containing protein [Candidatus Eisenbacteria bacterium]|nr:CDGSH iron-sulfur domain-containing protein [Candidatus Latescibacterota bacterium]MBD3302637.1 CDGSH iron-sulfur domain-containing protein [Candidatus Eisenbacteria bacterium]